MLAELGGIFEKMAKGRFGDWVLGSFGDLLRIEPEEVEVTEVITNPHLEVARQFKSLYTPEISNALENGEKLNLDGVDEELSRRRAVWDFEKLFEYFYAGKQHGLTLRDLSNAVFLNMREVGEDKQEAGEDLPAQKDFDKFWLFTEQLLSRYGAGPAVKPDLLENVHS